MALIKVKFILGVRSGGKHEETTLRKMVLYVLKLFIAYQRVLKNNLHIPPEKTFTFAPGTENFFLCVLRLRFFKMFLQVVADGIGVLVSDLKKISPSGSRRERYF